MMDSSAIFGLLPSNAKRCATTLQIVSLHLISGVDNHRPHFNITYMLQFGWQHNLGKSTAVSTFG